jgi:hypothetical protein
MPKPPSATPHSDIDGVHKDEQRNTDAARRVGDGAEQLARAGEKDAARPPHSDDVENRDDRAE